MKVTLDDADKLVPLLNELWKGHTSEELKRSLTGYIKSYDSAVFAEMSSGRCIGVALCGLRRDYVEGCETSPVGYLEGVYVDEAHRRKGIGRKLVSQCEEWAKEMGCTEFASDCELVNGDSLSFHLGIGFSEENRIICFKKLL